MAEDADISPDFKQREKQLFEQLIAAPVSEILALVGPKGASGGKFHGDTRWSMSFIAEAWRESTGAVQKRRLAIHRKVAPEELKAFQNKIMPYQVIRLRTRIVEADSGNADALLEAFVKRDSFDAELNAVAESLQKPVTFDDPLLGMFILDRSVDWFTGEVVWTGESISLNLLSSEGAQEALRTAYARWEDQAEWNRRIRSFAVEELLPLKNEAWIDEDEAELTPHEFNARMTLESITANGDGDGSFDFCYDDGGLFSGHAITVSGSISQGLEHANIFG